MTNKIYKTAQGKSIDLGTIILKNEHVRAVGNMNVNARGDILDQANNVIETKPQLVKRQNSRLTNVSADPIQTSQRKPAPQTAPKQQPVKEEVLEAQDEPEITEALAEPPAQEVKTTAEYTGPEGLAGAIARTRQIKQELEKTRRQRQQAQGVRKI